MDYEKQVSSFMKRKAVREILGSDYVLSSKQYERLCKLLDIYKTPKAMENMLTTVANFIYYDLTNYVGRYRRLVGIPGTSKYTQTLRYGRNSKKIYNQQTSKKIKHFKNTSNFWINLGFSEIEARKQVQEIQTARALLSAKKIKGTSLYTVRSKEFWINNGYTEDEAIEKVKSIQITNGIDYYRKKYPNDYEERFLQRIKKWKDSYNQNDLVQLNLKKSHSVAGAMARGLSYDDAVVTREKNVNHLQCIRKIPSKISQKFCEMLEIKLLGTCYYDTKNYEKLIAGYRVDFYHQDTKTAIEFYGDFYHRNPALFKSDHFAFNMTALEKWEYDNAREKKIRNDKKVDRLLIVWESDFRKSPSQTIDKIIKEIL